jgi:hypothetical protein
VLLTGFLRAAVGHVERRDGQEFEAEDRHSDDRWLPGRRRGHQPVPSPYQAMPGRQAIRLWSGPVTSILSSMTMPNGVEQTLSSFRLVEGANAKLLPAYGASWPATACGPGTVRITLCRRL